ncbi:MAG: ABC transporter ATP-binding protein [Magnetococcales bacterium]|nr:ABC transporter ATP-binding protein [Magnetococcales bacterium]
MKTVFPAATSFLRSLTGRHLPASAAVSLSYRLRHLLPHYRRHLGKFGVGFLLLAATSLSAASIPYAMKRTTEALLARESATVMAGFALLLIVLALVNGAFRIAGRVHIFGIGRQVEYDLRNDLHRQILHLDNTFFDHERTGDLVSRCTNDITSVRMFIGPGFLQVCNTIMVYLTVLPIMAGLDPYLTLMALLPFPLVLLLARFLTGRLYRLSRTVADRFGHTSSFVQESIAGMAVLRAHAQEENWRDRFATTAQTLYIDQMRHARLQSLFAPLMTFGGGLGAWIILAMSGPEVVSGRLTIGDFVAFSGYLVQLVWPTVGLGWILTVLQRGFVALERIGRILDTKPAIPSTLAAASQPSPTTARDLSPEEAQRSLPFQGHVRVAQLTFHYPGTASSPRAAPILKGIDMELQPGQFVGLVGRVGSGKSTLLNCLARLYPVPAGSIHIDGMELGSIDEQRLRRHLAMVPQESILFSTTMQENLLFSMPDAPEERAWHVASRAHMDAEIRAFPSGMATLVGERGITLSGGQRQRTALARALALDPSILLLDDVFSSVDAQTEESILERIRQENRQRTTVMVCHRVAALHQADQIFLLDQGSIVARGTHAELIDTSPLYQDLHHTMLRHQALEALQ